VLSQRPLRGPVDYIDVVVKDTRTVKVRAVVPTGAAVEGEMS